MNPFWLMLNIVSFTPDSQITVRELLIPFASQENCETALKAILYTTHGSGVAVDSGACVISSNEDEFKHQTMPWPDNRTLDEKKESERQRLLNSK